MKITRSRIFVIFGSLVFIILAQWVFQNAIIHHLGNLQTNDVLTISRKSFFIQILLAIIPSLWISPYMDKPSHYQCWILYTTVIIPACIAAFYLAIIPQEDVILFLFFMISCFGIICIPSHLSPFHVPRIYMSWKQFGVLIFSITLITYTFLIYYFGFPRSIPGVEEVSGFRQLYKSAQLPGGISHLVWWQGTFINPLIIGLGLFYRSYFLVIIGILLQIELFALTSLRTFVSSSFLVLSFGIMVLSFKKYTGLAFLYLLLFCIILTSIFYLIDETSFIPIFFLKRWIFNAGILTGKYIEFFSQHQLTGLQDSLPILRWLFPGPYDISAGEIIGCNYFLQFPDGSCTNATAHIWANAYSAFGYKGVFIASLIAASLMWIIDSIYFNTNKQLALIIMCMPAISLSGQGVHTSILSGGIGLVILVGLILPLSTKKSI